MADFILSKQKPHKHGQPIPSGLGDLYRTLLVGCLHAHSLYVKVF